MAFPQYPRLTPHKISTEKLVETGDSAKTFWLSASPPSWSSGTATFSAPNQRVCSPLSRYFSPFCCDVEIDASFTHTAPASGTSRMRFGVASSSGTGDILGATNSCIFAESTRTATTHTIRLLAKQALPGGDPNAVGTVLVSQVCAFTVGRIRLELRKENWTVTATSGTAGSQYRLRIYDNAAAVQYDLTGSHNLDWEFWTQRTAASPTAADLLDVGHAWAALGVGLTGAATTCTVTDYAVRNVGQNFTYDTVYGPYIDGVSLELPDFDTTEQPYLLDSKVLPTAEPFNADGSGASGTAAANTTAVNNALHWSSEYSMDLFLGPNVSIQCNNQITTRQWVYQRTNASADNRRGFADESRPGSIEGSTQGTAGAKSILKLANSGTGYGTGTNNGTAKSFILLNTTAYDVQPPTATTSDNSNYNQQVKNLRIEGGTGNAGARYLEMLGAQGTEAYRLEFVASTGFCMIYNLPGSGGAIHTLDMDGSGAVQYGIYADAAQPGPVVSGVYSEGILTSHVRIASSGNRGVLLLLGWGVQATVGQTVFDFSGAADTDGGQNTQRGQAELRDCVVQFPSSNAANTLLNCNRSVVIENCWVQNCAKIVEHPSGDIASPSGSGWIHIERIVIPYDPPTKDTGGIASPSDYPYQADNYIDGVVSTSNITEYGTPAVAPAGSVGAWDVVDEHRISDADWINWEKADIDVAVDHSTDPDGLTDNLAAMDAAMVAASSGDILYFRRGYWMVSDAFDVLAGRHIVGANKQSTTFITVKQPAAADPFGSAAATRAVIRTAASSSVNIMASFCVQKGTNIPTGYAMLIRGGHLFYNNYCLRGSYYGFGGYTGSGGTTDQVSPFMLWTGIAEGKNFNLNQGATGNTVTPYTHFQLNNVTGHVQFYHINAEHVHNWPGNIGIDNCARVTIWNYKGESNWPAFNVIDTLNFLCYGVTGNGTAFIPDGVLPPGEVEGAPDDTTGYNPEPVEYPSAYTPVCVHLENVTNFRISQTQDEGRQRGGHPVFGIGTRVDYFHFGAEYTSAAVETLLLPVGYRPTLWTSGDVYATETPVVISDASDESFTNGESIPVTGSGFQATQGTGRVVISPTDNIADAGAVAQTVTLWGASSITITTVRSALAYNTPLYLFVENDDDVSNTSGHVVQFEPAATITNTLYDEDGLIVANEVNIKVSIWRNREPSGAPDQEITGESTNGAGSITVPISATGLAPGDPVYILFYKDHATAWQCGIVKVVPTYS